MPMFGRKTSNLWKLHYFMAKKVNRMSFFSIFSRKYRCCVMPIFDQKYAYSLKKKHSALKPISCQKTSFLSKTVLSCHLVSIFHENSLPSSPYLVKNINSVKTSVYFGSDKAIGCPFPGFSFKTNGFYTHIL